MDLADLYDLMDLTNNRHITLVAHHLAKESRNHLRAFLRALTAQGETNTPQYLDQATFDAILEADMERRMSYDADGEPVAACGAGVGGFGMRRGNGQDGGSDGSGTLTAPGPMVEVRTVVATAAATAETDSPLPFHTASPFRAGPFCLSKPAVRTLIHGEAEFLTRR